MRIAMDGLHLFGSYSGVQYAQTRLMRALRESFPSDELVLYVPRDFDGPPHIDGQEPDAGLGIHRTWFPGRWRVIRTLWRNFRMQMLAYKHQCDLLHGPVYALPALMSMPAVVTIHDVIPLTYPAFCTPGSARIQKKTLPRSTKVARRIIVPSTVVKQDVERELKLPADRIDVIPWGVGEEFKVINDKKRLQEARKRWQLPKRFVLFVGTLEPKKNIEGLIKGFFAAKVHGKLPHSLVLAGRRGWGMKGLESLIKQHNAQDFINFSGYVPEGALPLLYNLADLLVLPSHVEGFGMPVLEAMACGCPVMISDAPALKEVAGDAAHVCTLKHDKPLQVMREDFEHLLEHPSEREKLSRKGLERAKAFSWTETAKLTHASYVKALE